MLVAAPLRSNLGCSWTVDPATGTLRSVWCGREEAELDEQRLGDGLGFAPQPAFVHEPSHIDEVRSAA